MKYLPYGLQLTFAVALVLGGSGAFARQPEPASPGAIFTTVSTDASVEPSQEARPADTGFNLNALDLNVYGLSYHPDRETVHRENLDNQVNPGLALHYELVNDARGITFTELGAYRDSGETGRRLPGWATNSNSVSAGGLGARWPSWTARPTTTAWALSP